MHMCFSGKENNLTKLRPFFKLKHFHVELSQNNRFVIQLNMFLLPYVFGTDFDFFKNVRHSVFLSEKYDKMLAFLNL